MSIYDDAGVIQIPSAYKKSVSNGTLYSVVPSNGDGDFTFTRGSSATRVNKDGLIEEVSSHIARLDYPLIDGEVQDCPALLLEPSRTNTFQRSEEFDNAYWSKSRIETPSKEGVVDPICIGITRKMPHKGITGVSVTEIARIGSDKGIPVAGDIGTAGAMPYKSIVIAAVVGKARVHAQ